MGNLNGKFDASTVKAYTRINLSKLDSYESNKTATEVLTKRSALSLVKSGLDQRRRTNRTTNPMHLSVYRRSKTNPSVKDQPLRRMLPHKIVGLSSGGDQITLAVTNNSHKFSSIHDAVISSGGELSDHSFVGKADTMYELHTHSLYNIEIDMFKQGPPI